MITIGYTLRSAWRTWDTELSLPRHHHTYYKTSNANMDKHMEAKLTTMTIIKEDSGSRCKDGWEEFCIPLGRKLMSAWLCKIPLCANFFCFLSYFDSHSSFDIHDTVIFERVDLFLSLGNRIIQVFFHVSLDTYTGHGTYRLDIIFTDKTLFYLQCIISLYRMDEMNID